MSFLRFVARRVLLTVPAALAVLVITFAMIRLVPGDPVTVIAGTNLDPQVAADLRRQLGLDDPLRVQFLDYVGNVLRGDLGTSFLTHRPVTEIVAERLPYTLMLTVAGVLTGLLLSVPIGVASALRDARKRRTGVSFTAITTLFVATPDFLLGTVLVSVLAVYLQVFPVAGAQSWDSIVLPALALGIPLAGIQARVIRTSVLDVATRPFVRTLRAAGVPERRLLARNVLPNASIPVVTLLSVEFGRLLAGALIVENIFAWPGLGTVIFDSIGRRDLPAVQGEILVVALLILGINLVIDVIYRLIDPRISLA
ncbi:glutathione ABC transporter permease GsiC [Dactylosporangium fulvum]|uniref:ABC transporter permease n=1 Tax=Dactylosporangium fulvum TaxID=53359 RepID=A0ABY5VW28_9ACTN|nr:ABC transporter permease [Dactylosporangium fulvum]UWP79991.1 ABC transporter permease [Dactylosporangium fulvum]